MNIIKILENDEIEMYFQPIISTYKNKISGFEALMRGREDGKQINPDIIFNEARNKNRVVELDLICHEKAIRKFSLKLYNEPNVLLFLNVDHDTIIYNKESIKNLVEYYNVNPNNIVIEINELQIDSSIEIINFCKYYKSLGYLISVDDVGSESANFDRLVMFEPDIVKIDKQFVMGIDKYYYKQKIVETFTILSEKLGALTVAEGVETLDEFLTIQSFGVHFIQGFYFSKPMPIDHINCNELENRIIDSRMKYHEFVLKKDEEKSRCEDEMRTLFEDIKKSIDDDFKIDFKNSLVECYYLLNEEGIQISDTVFLKEVPNKKTLFVANEKGDSAKLSKYYYKLKNKFDKIYISDEYLSLATGNRCRTLSGYILKNNVKYILCLDIMCNY